ncbi:MAG: response regulator [Mariprofundaceae bacterium]|nr:response regulator [Mariprofundaceae bacterium]
MLRNDHVMADELHILFLEDNADDIASAHRALEKSKQTLDIQYAINMDEFSKALKTSHWDIILCDVNLPELMVKDVLRRLKELSVLIPLIVLAKPIGEEVVAQFLRAGVSNYVNKLSPENLLAVIHQTLLDVEEQKLAIQKEKIFISTGRMEVAKTLAGGLAHDLNNLMVGVVTGVELLRQYLPKDGEPKHLLDLIYQSGMKATDVSGQMLAYVQGGKYRVEDMDVNALLMAFIASEEFPISDCIDVQLDLSKDIPFSNGDPAQIRKLFSGIVLNACEAMMEGGVLRISTRNRCIERDELLPEVELESGDYVEICIEDNGIGMDDAVQMHLFEPFYTTKFQGRGLGMAAAHGIIRNHQGEILVESEIGKGSTFRVLLPVAKEQESPSMIQRRRVFESYAGTEHVLLIDDDPTVLKVMQALIRQWGYKVSVATNGALALQLLEKNHYDLAILDLNLPDYSGEKLFLKLREPMDTLPVLMISASPANAEVEALLDSGACNFLRKPFVPNELGGVLRQLLD